MIAATARGPTLLPHVCRPCLFPPCERREQRGRSSPSWLTARESLQRDDALSGRSRLLSEIDA